MMIKKQYEACCNYMEMIEDMKGNQAKGTHGSYCSHCGHYDEVHFRGTDCDCICHDEKTIN